MTDLTALTEITSPVEADIAYTVNLPGSSKNPRKVTWANVSNLLRTITEILSGKTIVVEDNTLSQTTPSSGDYLKDNGTKFVAGVFSTDVAANSAVTANTAKISYTDASAVALNTAKISYTDAAAVTANTAKVTNATHTGDVTGSTALTVVAIGTPTSGVLTNCTGLPLTTGVTGTLPVGNGGTGVTTSTGSGANALATSPTLVTPVLGIPTSGTLTNCTGLPLTTGVTGVLPSANMDSDTAHLTTTQTFSGAKTFTLQTSHSAGADMVGNNVDNVQNIIHDISTSGVDIDFSEDELQTITLTGTTTFTTTSRAIGKSKTLKISAGASTRTLSFPAWTFVGAVPTDIAANKDAILTVTNFGTTDALIIAAYAVEE